MISRQISRKTGSEYARLTMEDFHGTAEAIVFPDTWRELSNVIVADAAFVLTGSYSPRDKGEEKAPFIIEGATRMDELKSSGAVGVEISWTADAAPSPDSARAMAALCVAHPGQAPLTVEWSGGNGSHARLRSHSIKVEINDEFYSALKSIIGAEHVKMVKTR